ncbi:tetratricopeptide repeat protein [Candidatus Magnetaquiglobus chichijimensis]
MQATPLRIFISSPSDVPDERRRAALVIERLKKEFKRFFDIRPILWEEEVQQAAGHIQDRLDKPSLTDIVVVILWSRLGSPLPDRYRDADGRIPTGTEWEFENAKQANRATGKPDLLLYLKTTPAMMPVNTQDQEARARRIQWEALQNFLDRHFKPCDGQVREGDYHTFDPTDTFEKQLEADLRRLIKKRIAKGDVGANASEPGITWNHGSPFRGLQPFDTQHAPVFFGREQAERKVIDQLVHRAEKAIPFLLILGASGSGKSSLIRAGVLPHLAIPGVVSGVGWWRMARFRPSDGEGNPWVGLARALLMDGAPELGGEKIDDKTLGGLWQANPASGVKDIQVAMQVISKTARDDSSGKTGRLVLVVDQLEEIFTSVSLTAEENDRFVGFLEALAKTGQVWVIAAMRSDFFHRLDDLPRLRDLASGLGQYHLAPPSLPEIEQMITRPANAAGLGFDVDQETGLRLDELILQEAELEPGSLPLLEFALDELYRQDVALAKGDVLTSTSYRTLGGLVGAIAQRAEEICQELDGPTLAAVLRALVTTQSEDDRITSRAANQREVANTPEKARILEKFVHGRLVVTRGDALQATFHLAHETLLTRWPRLKRLIEEERAFLKLRDRLEADRSVWQKGGEHPELLLPAGKRLAEAEELLRQRRDELAEGVPAFIEHSSRHEKEQRDRRLRRARWVAIGLGGLALAASGFGWRAYQQEQRAEQSLKLEAQARTKEKQARSQAEELVNFVIFDLRDRLIPLGRLDLMKETAHKALAYYERLGEPSQLEPMQQRQLSAALNNIGNVFTDLGNLTEAQNLHRKAQEIDKRLARLDPNNTQWQRDLWVSHNKIGEILQTQGEQAAALTEFRAGMAITKRLAKLDPNNTQWQRDLQVSHNKIGDMLKTQGEQAAALTEFRAGMAIAKRLAALEPDNTEGQRDVWVSHNKIGEILQTQGEQAAAITEFRAGMAIAKRLAKLEPNNTQWQRDLSISHNKLGDILKTQGEQAAALTEFRAGMAIAKRLAKLDPNNTEWQRDLRVSHNKIGDMLKTQGEQAAALTEFRAGMAIAKRLAELDPNNTQWQRDLSISHDKIGGIFQTQGEQAAALTEFRAGMAIAKRLAELDPNNTEWQRDLSISHNKIGDMLKTQGEQAAALTEFRAGMAIAKRLAKLDPNNTQWQRDVWVSHNKIGDMLKTQGEQAAALTEFRASMAIAKRLAELDPNNTQWQRDLQVSHNKIGDMLKTQGEQAAALTEFRAGMAIAKRLAALEPDNTEGQRDVWVSHNKIGEILQTQGEQAAAITEFRAGMAIAKRLAELDPDNTEWQRDLSISHNKLGDILQTQGERDAALTEFRADMAIAKHLAELDPDNTEWQRDLSISHNKLGEILQTQGEQAAALTEFRAGMAIAKRLAELDPDNTQWQRGLAISHERMGMILRKQSGQEQEAMGHFRTEIALIERMFDAFPKQRPFQFNLSIPYQQLVEFLLENNDTTEAAKVVENWLAREPESPKARQFKAKTAEQKK